MTEIRGNTYPVKDQIRALGGKWNADAKCWQVPDAKAEAARKLVADAPVQQATPGKCSQCRGPVKEPYKVCYACKNKGKCLNCGAELDRWERQHGVKRCADCRDGGGNAHGGMSYYDRNGNFVLGDDD